MEALSMSYGKDMGMKNWYAFKQESPDALPVENGFQEIGVCLEQAPVNGFQDIGVCLEQAPMQLDSSSEAADPLKDPVFNYISDMLLDEVVDEKTCMFIDCSGYQAMTKELTQIISDSSSSGASPSPAGAADESWIDDLFRGGDDEGTSDLQAELSSEVRQPVPDDVLEKNMITFLDNMQQDIEQEQFSSDQVKAPVEEESIVSSVIQEDETVLQSKEFMSLKSLLVECSDYLRDPGIESTPQEHPDYYRDLLPPSENHVEAGMIREVVEDSTAIENEKALRAELLSKLVECAQAVSSDNISKAYAIVNSVRDRASPHGSGTERLIFYFAEALVARITGTGPLLYSALSSNKPPATEMLKAYSLSTRYFPNVRISHYFTNKTILDVSEGAARVHIVDYGILYGFGWPCLIKAFSERKGGPPHLRITGIDFPQPGFKPAERVEETGRRLADYAKQVGVPFEYHAIATSKWESVQPSTLFLRHDEVLVVNSYFRLRHLLDESVMVDSPRKLVLSRIRSMKPKVFTQSIMNANYNAPFFLSRFREAVACYSNIFEAIDAAISPEYPERLLIEQSIIGREILNVVSCEGVERVERAETYKQWQSRTMKAGFEQLPLHPEIYAKSRAMMSTYHKNFGIGQDGNWLILGWKDTVLHAMCSWKAR